MDHFWCTFCEIGGGVVIRSKFCTWLEIFLLLRATNFIWNIFRYRPYVRRLERFSERRVDAGGRKRQKNSYWTLICFFGCLRTEINREVIFHEISFATIGLPSWQCDKNNVYRIRYRQLWYCLIQKNIILYWPSLFYQVIKYINNAC